MSSYCDDVLLFLKSTNALNVVFFILMEKDYNKLCLEALRKKKTKKQQQHNLKTCTEISADC